MEKKRARDSAQERGGDGKKLEKKKGKTERKKERKKDGRKEGEDNREREESELN